MDETNDLTLLDVYGDAVLYFEESNNHKTFQFRISTKVLGLASPVFAKMFGPDFEEGYRIRREECPLIKLQDDDAPAMEIILTALHYRGIDQLHPIDAERLATLAIHCDKYDCINALRPWISQWFHNLEMTTETTEELAIYF